MFLLADIVSRGILVWMGIVAVCMLQICIHQSGIIKDNSTFFNIGRNKDLILFGVPIDTIMKYLAVVIYTIISTVVRTLQQEVIMPWIIQNVQNTNEKDVYTRNNAYLIVITDVVFRWVDWFMYLNILLAQIDFLVIEMTGNMCMSIYTTRFYLRQHQTLAMVTETS